jgi:hypothetical protein
MLSKVIILPSIFSHCSLLILLAFIFDQIASLLIMSAEQSLTYLILLQMGICVKRHCSIQVLALYGHALICLILTLVITCGILLYLLALLHNGIPFSILNSIIQGICAGNTPFRIGFIAKFKSWVLSFLVALI